MEEENVMLVSNEIRNKSSKVKVTMFKHVRLYIKAQFIDS